MIKNVYWSSCNLPIIYVKIKFKFYAQIFKKKKYSQISNFIKICPVGGVMIHADTQAEGQTDRQTDRHEDSCHSK